MQRQREPVNIWPGFVDLFSNLTIILMFLLIVFVVIASSAKFMMKGATPDHTALTELTERARRLAADNMKMRASQDELLRQKAIVAETAARLEIDAAAKDRALANALLELERTQTDTSALDEQRAQLQIMRDDAAASDIEKRRLLEELENLRGTLRAESETKSSEREMSAVQMRNLSEEISRLSNALAVSEQKAAENEVQYVELSNRFNRALADKLAEQADVREYQSMFYTAIKKSLGDTGMIKMDDDRFTLPSDIMFPQGSAKISDKGKAQLKQIAGVIKEIYTTIPKNVEWIIRVDGHTDNVPVKPGSELKDNTQLSLMRARSVVDELVKNGIDRRLLAPTGFGEMYPVALGNTPADLQKNRRIELRLTNP
ncbi:MAG: OmpA family protein [Rickettsiales bacterium]|jgi:chemotaxis protein MotB|nr:OmpA family protein [Rickettsiales bacterium]